MQRAVEWILWNTSNDTALIIIPEEAEQLLPIFRTSLHAKTLHLIAYAAPVTRAMHHFNSFLYYSIPAVSSDVKLPTTIALELGFIAGRLYFDFSEYEDLKDYVHGSSAAKPTHTEAHHDRSPEAHKQRFTRKPAAFLLDWLNIRRKTQDILHTPMGYLCQNRQLQASHPFFTTQCGEFEPLTVPSIVKELNSDDEHESDYDSDMYEDSETEEAFEMEDGMIEEGDTLVEEDGIFEEKKDAAENDCNIVTNGSSDD